MGTIQRVFRDELYGHVHILFPTSESYQRVGSFIATALREHMKQSGLEVAVETEDQSVLGADARKHTAPFRTGILATFGDKVRQHVATVYSTIQYDSSFMVDPEHDADPRFTGLDMVAVLKPYEGQEISLLSR